MTDDSERLLHLAHGIKGMSRRSFLVGAGFGLTLAADLFLTRRIQEEREELQVLPVTDDEAARRFPRTRWIIFPGYKTSWEEGGWIANSLQPALSQRGQISVVGYSNRGLNVANIVAALNRYVRIFQVETLYFYGHSFGGMVAIEVASKLRSLGINVELIILDSSPHSRDDVLDQAVFEGVVLLYDAGYRVPTVLRGGYELGERIVNKDERTWQQILNQTLEQLSPLAPSSVLIQSQSSYIYHYNVTRFQGTLGDTQIAFIGNPHDGTVNYSTARPGWAEAFPDNLVSADYVTEGAVPAHASPQWNPLIYQSIVVALQDEFLPRPRGGYLKTIY
ncbi:thioesterase domain-containing protein [Arthrobacter sp. TMN-50]